MLVFTERVEPVDAANCRSDRTHYWLWEAGCYHSDQLQVVGGLKDPVGLQHSRPMCGCKSDLHLCK